MSIYDVSERERRRRAQEMAQLRAMGRMSNGTSESGSSRTSTPTREGEGEEEKGFWASAGDFFGNILKGALKGIEGIWDFGASVVGEVGGWFDEGFKEDVRKHVEYDFTGAATDPWLKDLEKQSYLGEDSFLRNMAQGVGGMLPAVVTGGATHIGAVGTGMMMAGAAGQGTEDAFKSGADYESALFYGAGSGAVEGITEKIGGFTFGGTSKLGKAVAGTRLSKGLGKVAFDAVSEGAEEVLADYIDPALKYATGVDKNIGENYLEAAKNTGKTFLTGAAVGSVMQGGQNFIRSHVANKDRGGSHATKADNAVANIIEATGNYNGAANNDFKYDKVVKYNLETVSSELVKMSPEARKNYLDSIGIYKNAFDRETGKLKENSMPYAHREAITANLRTFSGNLSHKPLTGGENITNGAKTAKKTVERVVGSGAAVVVTNELSSEDRAIYNPDDGVIYINNNADLTEKDVAKAVALHEVTHTTEGTKAYRTLVKQIEAIANDTNAPESVKKIIGDIALRKFSTANSYEAEMEDLSKEQSRYLVDTEVSADLIGDLLSDDYFIEKLAERDMGLLQKLYHSFKNRANAKKSELGPEGIKYLKKLASKFGTAIEKRANYVQLSQNGDDKEEKEVESASKLRYNKDKSKAKIARYISYDIIGDANIDAIKRKLIRLYFGTNNTIANTIAVEHGNVVYIVDSSKENGKINFGVREQISISDKNLRNEYIRRKNNDSISKGHISDELLGKFRNGNDSSGQGDIGREPGEELSTDTGKSQDNQGRVPDENGDRGRGVNSTERKSKIRSYDPKNGKEPTFEEVEGGVKINFNDFDTNKSNDLVPKGSSSRENEAWGYAAAEKARRESLDALLKDGEPPRYSSVSTDTDTALLRKVVNNTKAKKYTRADVKAIVTELLSSEGYFGDNTVVMKGKKRAELEKMLWQALNTKGKGELGGAALDAAEYIIQNAIAVEYLEVTDDIQLAVQFVDALKPYLHNMNLDFIKGDIKAKLDKDKTPYLMWAVKKDSSFRGYTADEVAQELEALGFTIDKTNEADIFIEINELYRLAKQTITDAVPTKDTLLNALGTKKAKKLKQALAKDILTAQEEKGTETSFYKLQQKYIKQIAELGEKVKTAHRRNTLENRILKEARRIADSNKHTFANATEVQTVALKNIKKLLSRVNSREQVNRISLRAIMKELAIWYSEKNPVLEGFYDNYIAEHLAYFAETEIEETPSTAERSPSLKDGGKDAAVPTIEISPDSELIKRIENSNKSKYDVIEEYLIEKFYGERFMLSDGKSAIMDKRDANKLSAKANPARTTQLGNLKEIVEKAVYSHSAENIEHNKFSKFEYYSISVKIGEDTFNLWLNVGTAKNDGERHIYALTNKKEEAPTKNGVSRPVGNAIQNASSTDIIPEKTENVKREKPLSMGELEMVQIILHHMNHVFENFGKMWRGGKYVEASDVASAQYDKLKEAEANHSSFEKAILHNKALRYIMDPMAVLAAWDGHDPDGYFTTTYREFAEGLIGQRWDEMQALAEFDEFRKTHKKYFKTLTNGNDKIKVSGRIDPRNLTISKIEIPKNVAIDLYMVSKTGQAIVTLEEVGYKVRIDGQHEQETMQTITKAQIEEMYNRFSEEDKELISIMERAYNGYCRDLKYNTDMKRLGFSNVFEGYYYPINRIGATDFDTDNFFQMMERVSNISANKSRVKGAKNAIVASNALTKFMRHVNAVARYANLAIPVENMNRVFNLDISGDKHMPTSIKMKLSENVLWKGAEDYMKRLTDDVQQIGIKPDGGSKTISWLRGNYAKFQLGANPKVWFTQLSSYFASFGELRASSLAKAVAIDGSDVDKYCRLAAIRHYDKAATVAQTLTDKTGNVLTVPIEAVDRGVIRKLFAACQAEAQARYKLEIGTEENKIKAGEILTEVILKTQQNQLITEQSAAMRSTSEIIKSFTMFSADSMKLLSRFVQYMGEVSTLNKRIKAAKANGDTALAEQLTAQRNKAVKSLVKSSVSILAVSVWMAALAKLFKLLYNKDDEEETVAEWLGEGTLGNIIGMVPFIRDAYSYFADGYDTDIFVTSMANDVLKSLGKTRDIFTAWVSGENVTSEQFYSNIRSLTYSFGQIFGLPTRNVYNFTTGIIRRIDEGTGKSIDAWFKEPSESDAKASLREGLENDDTSLTEYGLNQMYNKYGLELADNALKREMDRLVKMDASGTLPNNEYTGEKVNLSPLGFKIPENLEIDGEDVELSAEDRKVFKNGLRLAEKSSAAMVKTYYYRQLGDKYKAYAMRKVFEYYDLVARYEVAGGTDGRGRPSLQYYGEAVGIDMLAVLLAYKQELNAVSDEEKTRRGKSTKELITEYLKRFNLTPVQKSLVLRALGYSDKDNDKLVKSFIERRPGLSKEQRAEFTQIAKCDL